LATVTAEERSPSYKVADPHGATSTATAKFAATRTVDDESDNDGNGVPDWWEITRCGVAGCESLPDPVTRCPASNDLLGIVDGKLQAGNTITVAGSEKWLAHSIATYYVCSSPTVIGQGTAGETGNAAATVVLPRHLSEGEHQLFGVGTDPSGVAMVQVFEGHITAAPPQFLAYTGVNTSMVVITGVVLMILGYVLLTLDDRKQPGHRLRPGRSAKG